MAHPVDRDFRAGTSAKVSLDRLSQALVFAVMPATAEIGRSMEEVFPARPEREFDARQTIRGAASRRWPRRIHNDARGPVRHCLRKAHDRPTRRASITDEVDEQDPVCTRILTKLGAESGFVQALIGRAELQQECINPRVDEQKYSIA